MERSIEHVWKEGFLEMESLIAPKLNDLYNQKSMHIVDRFKRTGKRNLYGIALGSILFFGITIILKIPLVGILVGMIMAYLIWVGKKRSAKLELIEQGVNSYEYLKSFDNWLNETIAAYRQIYRYVYPALFAIFIIGAIYAQFLGQESLASHLFQKPPEEYTLGIPLIALVPLLLIVLLVRIFSDVIYRFDVYSVYGGILKKLDELLRDMEELRT